MTEEIERTTISISPLTKQRLREVGKMGQTDDDLVNVLIDSFKK